jgi:hypothetical protein
MEQNAGGNDGYQLRITYNAEMGNYMLTGYVVRMDQNNIMKYDQDGATLFFETLERALSHIIRYGE